VDSDRNEVHLTTCPYCGVGCQFYLKETDARIVGIIPSEGRVNEGKLCIKGWAAHEFIHDPQRLTKPLIRGKDGKFEEASWEQALSYVADKLKEIKAKYGNDAIGILASAKCTNEENYLMQKFARVVIGTNNVDHCARLCHASTVAD